MNCSMGGVLPLSPKQNKEQHEEGKGQRTMKQRTSGGGRARQHYIDLAR